MPHMIILPAAGVAGYAAWRLRKGPAQAEESDAAETPEVENPAQIDWEDVSDGATLGLEIGYGLIGLVDDRKGAPLMARITGIRRQLSRELGFVRSEEHTSELQSLMRLSYAVFCLNKKNNN